MKGLTHNKITIFLLLFFFTINCYSANKKDIPSWVFPNWETEFNDDVYLRQRASIPGKNTEEMALRVKTEALAQIARYISSSVNANIKTSLLSLDNSGSIDEISIVQNEVAVNSEVELFGVEYTEPYYLKSEKRWYCVAYINRDKAWEQYSPKIESEKEVFYGFLRQAQSENEPLLAISYYKEALRSAEKYLTVLEYGRLIHPAKEKKLYSQDRKEISKIPSTISMLLKSISVSLDITGDYSNIVETAIENAFKTAGLTVSKKGSYIAEVLVESNVFGENPLVVFPSIDLKLNGVTGETVYSYKNRLSNRTTAYTLESAQKKSYPFLAEDIEKTMPEELKQLLGIK